MGDNEQRAMANLHHFILPLLTASHNCPPKHQTSAPPLFQPPALPGC